MPRIYEKTFFSVKIWSARFSYTPKRPHAQFNVKKKQLSYENLAK